MKAIRAFFLDRFSDGPPVYPLVGTSMLMLVADDATASSGYSPFTLVPLAIVLIALWVPALRKVPSSRTSVTTDDR